VGENDHAMQDRNLKTVRGAMTLLPVDEAQAEAPLDTQPSWYFLLSPPIRAWRDAMLLKGLKPDGHIEKKLIQAGLWRKTD
jgi:hypothetical protein